MKEQEPNEIRIVAYDDVETYTPVANARQNTTNYHVPYSAGCDYRFGGYPTYSPLGNNPCTEPHVSIGANCIEQMFISLSSHRNQIYRTARNKFFKNKAAYEQLLTDFDSTHPPSEIPQENLMNLSK
ncbi:hypothetical protein RCL1_003371 [Eukaryota sp. TZLM3-RCL]